MASPAWAQETTLSVESTWLWQGEPLEPGSLLTYSAVVTNVGGNEAEAVVLAAEFDLGTTGVPTSFSASTTAGTCDVDNAPTEVLCALGDLAPGEDATVTIRWEPTSPGTIESLAVAWAGNAPRVYYADQEWIGPGTGLPGEEPGNDQGEWVLVSHKGKELCLPEAALNGHLSHDGDEVIDEEGCSDDTEGGGRRGLR